MDVSSLYTNIPHREGLSTAVRALEARTNQSVPTRVLIKFLSLILNLNNFCFNENNYIQTKGGAMGSKWSGSYADNFMGSFENQYIYPRINRKHRGYTRFKDDIFLIWTAGEKSLLSFFRISTAFMDRPSSNANTRGTSSTSWTRMCTSTPTVP